MQDGVDNPAPEEGEGDNSVMNTSKASLAEDAASIDVAGQSCIATVKKTYVAIAAAVHDRIVAKQWFRTSTFALVVLAGVVVAMQTYKLNDPLPHTLDVVDLLITWAFLAEAMLKIIAEGTTPKRYFKDGWNTFDFLIVIVSFLPVGAEQIKILRLIRLLRVLKVIRALPKLRVLVMSMLKSLSSLGYVSLLLLLVRVEWAKVVDGVVVDWVCACLLPSAVLPLRRHWRRNFLQERPCELSVVARGHGHVVPHHYGRRLDGHHVHQSVRVPQVRVQRARWSGRRWRRVRRYT